MIFLEEPSGWDVQTGSEPARLEAGRPVRMETDAKIQARNNDGLSSGWGHEAGEKDNL